MSSSLYAVQHVKTMRGGSQAHLLRASDGSFYVTKLLGNPQHDRVLANEMLASRLGRWLGLPIPAVEVIEICDWLSQPIPEFRFEKGGYVVQCANGRHLGSRYPEDPWEDKLFDYVPEEYFSKVKNRSDFARILTLDKWVANTDGRQAVFSKRAKKETVHGSFYRPGALFQRRKVELPGHGTAWSVITGIMSTPGLQAGNRSNRR